MMCQMTGRPPISTMGLGLRCDSSLMRVPSPPARMTHFIVLFSQKIIPPSGVAARDLRRELRAESRRGKLLRAPAAGRGLDARGVLLERLHGGHDGVRALLLEEHAGRLGGVQPH